MVCIRTSHHFKIFKGCLPWILLVPFLNTLLYLFQHLQYSVVIGVIFSILSNTHNINTIISTNFLVWKLVEVSGNYFWANHQKSCENCAFPQNFHNRKLGEISVFHAVTGKHRNKWNHWQRMESYHDWILSYLNALKSTCQFKWVFFQQWEKYSLNLIILFLQYKV